VHIRDNLELKPNAYRNALKGVEIGGGERIRTIPGDQPRARQRAARGRETRDPRSTCRILDRHRQREQAHALATRSSMRARSLLRT